ncbi:ubiquitin protein [Stemphylium lycopersici]|uniref:Ubiquitin protein n=1 Tax=Stemphylium lycopersici TaxID=183478 RepID=A0A364MUU5_STELY|nr:ubiquitin protein [Stemphylium lycopersici]RAR04303.1 ubiquitin protein [Stemphylium lycopersici]RAR11341.1 ubiquitin protein [Stemphylium lycopersici]
MASPADQAPTAPQSTPQQAGSGSRPQSSSEPLSTSAVEMKTLEASGACPAPADTKTTATEAAPATAPIATPTPPKVESSTSEDAPATASPSAKPAPPSALNRAETEAIGPSTDTPAANPDNTNGPVLVIMLLLTSGSRHPYKIEEKYLKKRNVKVENMDPYNISVYTLKELIWRDWREEWEARPTSPGSIRLIHFGRMLDDKSPLKDSPNVVHMTVKPQEVVDDEENAKTGKSGSRRDNDDEPTAGCRCIIL